MAEDLSAAEFRVALRQMGLTQARFAAISLTSPVTVNRWAQGHSAIPGCAVALLRLMAMTDAWREERPPPETDRIREASLKDQEDAAIASKIADAEIALHTAAASVVLPHLDGSITPEAAFAVMLRPILALRGLGRSYMDIALIIAISFPAPPATIAADLEEYFETVDS